METIATVVGKFEHVVHTTEAGLKVDTLRPVDADEWDEYRPASVTDKDGKELWRYQKDRYPDAVGILRDVDDTGYVLGYVNRQHLFEVIVVADLPKMRLVRDTDGREVYEGGRVAQALIELKELLAEDLKLEPVFSKSEALIVKILRQRRADAREREHQAKITAILSRPAVFGFTAEGQRLSGIPVVGDEYLLVPSGKYVISVDGYDVQAKKPGTMLEHFQVRKSGGGKVYKDQLRPVTDKDPSAPKSTTTKQGELIFEFNGAFDIISLYTRDGVQALHAAGLNGGSKVGLFPANPDGTVTICEVTKKGIKEIGRHKPLV